MDLLPKTITRPVGRLGAAAQNALEVARFGGLTTEEEPSPYDVLSEQRVYRLRRYYPDSSGGPAPPVLLVPPMMLAAEIYDVSASTSAVTILSEHGVDPWVVDFGSPEREEGGLERTLTDHVLAVSDAIDRVRDIELPADSIRAVAGDRARRGPDPRHDLVQADHRPPARGRDPRARAGTQAWYLDASGDTYRSLTGAAHRRFVGRAA